MRISLKDLLAFVAFCAVLLAFATFVGFGNGGFWFAVVGSAAMSAMFVAALVKRPKIAPRSPFVFLFLAIFPFGSWVLLVNAFVLMISGIAFSFFAPPTLRKAMAAAALCAIIALSAGIAPGLGESRKYAALRKTYPIVSLKERLQYEMRTFYTRDPVNIANVSVSNSLDAQEERLDEFRDERAQFAGIHDERAEKFVRSMGFGVSRMTFFMRAPFIDERTPLRNIQLDEITRDFSKTFKSAAPVPEDVHINLRDDFIDAAWFGTVVDPSIKVVGFVAHGFHGPRTLLHEEPNLFQIERLELVSPLKFDEPRVYVLDHLPRMDQLMSANAPTRRWINSKRTRYRNCGTMKMSSFRKPAKTIACSAAYGPRSNASIAIPCSAESCSGRLVMRFE
jgi:hypothetical protein